MKLNIKLEDENYCNECPCLIHGATNWICKYFNKIVDNRTSQDTPKINRLKICKEKEFNDRLKG